MSNLSYKKVTLEDIPLLVELDKKCFNRDFDNSFTEQEFKDYAFNKTGETGLIYLDDTLIGFYSWVDINDEETEIIAIAILPEHQKHGYGTKGIEMMLDKLAHKECIKIVTHPQNIVALRIYLNHNFIISDFRKDYYGPNQPRIVMCRTQK